MRYPLKKICGDLRLPYDPCADPENFPGGGGGGGGGGSKFPEGVLRKISTWQKLIIWQLLPGGRGGGVQIPRRGITENFNMAKINNLAIITRREGGGGVRRSGPPVTPSGSAHAFGLNVDKRQIQKSYDAHMNCKHIRHSSRSPTMSKRS